MTMYDELVKRLRMQAEFERFFTGEPMLYEQAADAIEELSKPQWIPVTERMPEVGKDVLCFCRAGIYFVLAWDGTHWHEGCDRYYMKSLATHWMPLPEPPKGDEA